MASRSIPKFRGILIVGAGSWGTTIAIRFARRNIPVVLYEHFPDVAKDIQKRRENKLFLPGYRFPKMVSVSNDLVGCVSASDIIFNAVPTQFIRSVYSPLQRHGTILRGRILVNLSKGIEVKSGKIISQVFKEILPTQAGIFYAVLSGPTHAEEVIEELPTTAVVASGRTAVARRVQALVSDRSFRLYTNTDVTGVELSGALKNCVAIAAGVCVGLGFGDNTMAALMTRGLHEITRLGVALGARRQTFSGLAGLGDLVVTCGSRHSRNRRFGELLAKGFTPAEISKKHRFVAEGVATSAIAVRLAGKLNVEVPIIQEVHNIIYKGKSAKAAVQSLLSRPVRPEEL